MPSFFVQNNPKFSDIIPSLFGSPKSIPSKFHYDAKGSLLFDRITRLNEYYVTRCEEEILNYFKSDISQFFTDVPFFRFVELGAGDSAKTRFLIRQFLNDGRKFEFIPIDYSHAALKQLTYGFQKEFPLLKTQGLVADYIEGMASISGSSPAVNLICFLGSSIGNFDAEQENAFLMDLSSYMRPEDYLLIGFDLKKEIAVLEKAYNDSEGVTKEWHLNMLDALNREFGFNFDRSKFNYHGFYNPSLGRIESWLVSEEQQTVQIPGLGKKLLLEQWEGIHVENSYKFNLEDIERLAEETGFVIEKVYLDSKFYFADVLFKKRARKGSKKKTVVQAVP